MRGATVGSVLAVVAFLACAGGRSDLEGSILPAGAAAAGPPIVPPNDGPSGGVGRCTSVGCALQVRITFDFVADAGPDSAYAFDVDVAPLPEIACNGRRGEGPRACGPNTLIGFIDMSGARGLIEVRPANLGDSVTIAGSCDGVALGTKTFTPVYEAWPPDAGECEVQCPVAFTTFP
jgi:hypothetical protein